MDSQSSRTTIPLVDDVDSAPNKLTADVRKMYVGVAEMTLLSDQQHVKNGDWVAQWNTMASHVTKAGERLSRMDQGYRVDANSARLQHAGVKKNFSQTQGMLLKAMAITNKIGFSEFLNEGDEEDGTTTATSTKTNAPPSIADDQGSQGSWNEDDLMTQMREMNEYSRSMIADLAGQINTQLATYASSVNETLYAFGEWLQRQGQVVKEMQDASSEAYDASTAELVSRIKSEIVVLEQELSTLYGSVVGIEKELGDIVKQENVVISQFASRVKTVEELVARVETSINEHWKMTWSGLYTIWNSTRELMNSKGGQNKVFGAFQQAMESLGALLGPAISSLSNPGPYYSSYSSGGNGSGQNGSGQSTSSSSSSWTSYFASTTSSSAPAPSIRPRMRGGVLEGNGILAGRPTFSSLTKNQARGNANSSAIATASTILLEAESKLMEFGTCITKLQSVVDSLNRLAQRQTALTDRLAVVRTSWQELLSVPGVAPILRDFVSTVSLATATTNSEMMTLAVVEGDQGELEESPTLFAKMQRIYETCQQLMEEITAARKKLSARLLEMQTKVKFIQHQEPELRKRYKTRIGELVASWESARDETMGILMDDLRQVLTTEYELWNINLSNYERDVAFMIERINADVVAVKSNVFSLMDSAAAASQEAAVFNKFILMFTRISQVIHKDQKALLALLAKEREIAALRQLREQLNGIAFYLQQVFDVLSNSNKMPYGPSTRKIIMSDWQLPEFRVEDLVIVVQPDQSPQPASASTPPLTVHTNSSNANSNTNNATSVLDVALPASTLERLSVF
jgi:hypothetical protein